MPLALIEVNVSIPGSACRYVPAHARVTVLPFESVRIDGFGNVLDKVTDILMRGYEKYLHRRVRIHWRQHHRTIIGAKALHSSISGVDTSEGVVSYSTCVIFRGHNVVGICVCQNRLFCATSSSEYCGQYIYTLRGNCSCTRRTSLQPVSVLWKTVE